VPVAQVVAGAREQARVGGARGRDLLGGGRDRDDGPAVDAQPVARAQHGAARQRERDLLAAVEPGAQPALAPLLEGERQRGDRWLFRGDAFPDGPHGPPQKRK
jgi:hypothetical protein